MQHVTPALELPIRPGSWTTTPSAMAGTETLDIAWSGTVARQESVPTTGGEGFLSWTDCNEATWWRRTLDLIVAN